MIETYCGVVRPHHLDHMGHMNVQWYAAKFDEATWRLFAMAGLTNAYFQKENKGMAALTQTTEYKAEALCGDLLVCRSEILEVKEKLIRFRHFMYEASQDKLLATSELLGAHLDRKIRKACPLPAAVIANCKALIA